MGTRRVPLQPPSPFGDDRFSRVVVVLGLRFEVDGNDEKDG